MTTTRAFQHVGERVYVEGVPFGGWIETGDCYTSNAPLWEGDIDLVATVEALTARLDAELEQVGWYTPGMAGGPNIGSLFDGKFSDDDEPVYRFRAAAADPTPESQAFTGDDILRSRAESYGERERPEGET